MYATYRLRWKAFLLAIFTSLLPGVVTKFLLKSETNAYFTTHFPAVNHLLLLYSLVWLILYLCMGIGAYFIWISRTPFRSNALYIYTLQLCVNLVWPFLFFKLYAFSFSFVWSLILCLLSLLMVLFFWKCRPLAGLLQLPNLFWVVFCAYFNYCAILT